jgi:hypothetical protein
VIKKCLPETSSIEACSCSCSDVSVLKRRKKKWKEIKTAMRLKFDDYNN